MTKRTIIGERMGRGYGREGWELLCASQERSCSFSLVNERLKLSATSHTSPMSNRVWNTSNFQTHIRDISLV